VGWLTVITDYQQIQCKTRAKAKRKIQSVCLFFALREEVESDLTFLGLLIMENRLKRETKSALEELSAAHIRSVMVTGI